MAQDMQPEKRNADYYQIVMVDFQAGKADEAMKIVEDVFMPAADASGTPKPQMIRLMTGEHDLALIWPVAEGPSAMEWSRSPEDVKWMQAMIDATGSQEAATAKLDEYYAYIASSDSMIGYESK
ncbi:MAG: hypothetical protein AAF205_04345 [Pseudomonadota bacterium]